MERENMDEHDHSDQSGSESPEVPSAQTSVHLSVTQITDIITDILGGFRLQNEAKMTEIRHDVTKQIQVKLDDSFEKQRDRVLECLKKELSELEEKRKADIESLTLSLDSQIQEKAKKVFGELFYVPHVLQPTKPIVVSTPPHDVAESHQPPQHVGLKAQLPYTPSPVSNRPGNPKTPSKQTGIYPKRRRDEPVDSDDSHRLVIDVTRHSDDSPEMKVKKTPKTEGPEGSEPCETSTWSDENKAFLYELLSKHGFKKGKPVIDLIHEKGVKENRWPGGELMRKRVEHRMITVIKQESKKRKNLQDSVHASLKTKLFK